MKYLALCFLVLVCALPALAHGDEEHDEDETKAVAIGDIAVPDNPTYHKHVRPIIEASCNACHSAGQIAAYSPFDNPEDVAWAAEDIRFHVVNGIMPPWMPSPENLPLKHDRRLSATEIATIAAWVDAGAPLGDPGDYEPAPTEGFSFAEIRADLTLQLDEAYTPAEDVLDDYRCFAFDLDIDSPQFITGYEFIPDVREMAHHGIAYLLDSEVDGEIDALDFADGRPGWSCYGGAGLSDRGDMIATWTPGTFGIRFPQGAGYRIKPGQIVVLQMHYNLWTTRRPDQTRIVMQLEPGDTELAELMTLPLTAPVEIPCPSGVEGSQCERENAIKRIADRFGETQSEIPDKRLKRCRQSLEDYSENTGENARTFCDYPSPFFKPLTVYGVLGHMHELGRSFRMELNPDGDESLLLLDIPRWDFHWQDSYQFAEPLKINFADVLRMSCAWDNSLSDDPRYVVWGEGTSDEMCFGTVMALKQ